MMRVGQARDRCARGRQWISLRLDGELGELEKILLAAHLKRCASCRTFAAQVELLVRDIRSRPVQRPRRALLTPALPRRAARLRVAPALALAAAALVAVIVGLSAGGSAVPSPRGFATIPPVKSALQVALRDDESLEVKRYRNAALRRPGTGWWQILHSGQITSL